MSVDTAPRFPGRSHRRRDPRLRDGRPVGPPAGVRAVRRRGHGRVEPARADHRPGAGAVPVRRPGLPLRRGPAGRPCGALRRHRHRPGGSAGLDRGGGDRRQARAGPEAAHPVRRRPGPAARSAGPRRGGRPPRRREPQRALGPGLAGGDLARPRRGHRAGRRGHAPARQAAAPAGRHPLRRRAPHAAHRLPPALGRHHPLLAARRWCRSGDHGAGHRLAGPGPARRGTQPVVGHAVDGDRLRGDGHPADRGQRGRLRARLPVLGARHHRHAPGQRAPGLRPARARRRLHAGPPCRCTAPGSSTASRPRWAS